MHKNKSLEHLWGLIENEKNKYEEITGKPYFTPLREGMLEVFPNGCLHVEHLFKCFFDAYKELQEALYLIHTAKGIKACKIEEEGTRFIHVPPERVSKEISSLDMKTLDVELKQLIDKIELNAKKLAVNFGSNTLSILEDKEKKRNYWKNDKKNKIKNEKRKSRGRK